MGSILSALYAGGEAEDSATDNSTSPVNKIHSSKEWKDYFDSSKDSNVLMVVDFAAAWCGPCKFIEPAINSMSAMFPGVRFLKIDVDEVPEVAKEYKVDAMPTFVLLKQGKEKDRVIGANKDELERKILLHMSM